MTISVRRVDQYVLDTELRMPFHFGRTTLTELPHLFVRVELGGSHAGHTGVAAEGLSPLWFLKEPGLTFGEGLERTFEVIDAAVDHASAVEAGTVFEFWRATYDRQREWAAGTDHPPLLWSFGVSLVERAVIDAFCRSTETPFPAAVRENALGVDLGAIYDELAGAEPAAYLPDPPTSTAVRHTVGFTDPLTAADLDGDDRLADGLPQTLSEYVSEQGVSHFKVKLSGDVEADLARLRRVADELEAPSDDYALTLDANEQYGDAESFRRDWTRLVDEPALRGLLDRLLYVEQPLARGDALAEATRKCFEDWPERPPLIIDESDGDLRSLERALECGYVGTSHKNCKGVFKGIANACLVERRRREGDEECVISGEDLSTIGPVALPQDLAVMGTIGATHVERNGHHYFRGASMLPDEIQRGLVESHGDLYRAHADGYPTLDVSDGRVSIESVLEAPFGYDLDLDVEQFTPRAAWRFEPA